MTISSTFHDDVSTRILLTAARIILKIDNSAVGTHCCFPMKNQRFYTGRFIMYSRITKNCYRKTVGQVFTKPVQIEGTIQFFTPSKLSFIVVYISAARRCECMW